MPRDLDRPLFRGQRPWFEIWFAVVIDSERRRALWIRQTMLAPKRGEGCAIVWAASFDAEAAPVVRKRILPLSAMRAGEGDVLVEHDDCRFGRRGAAGQAGELAWRIEWSGGIPRDRMPPWVPARVIVDGAEATGTLPGRAFAMHIWGRRRVPKLQWIWAPGLDLEMTAASLHERMTLGHASLRFRDVVGRPATTASTTGLVTARIAGARRLVRARAWADPERMVGYAYRDTDGRDLMVAQSDVASAQVEVWTRAMPGTPWRLTEERRSASGAAVEIHQREPLPGVAYVPWEASERAAGDGAAAEPQAKRAAAEPQAARVAARVVDDEVAWPEIRAVVALGLTYREHVRETGAARGAAPVAFSKHPRSVAIGGGCVPVPDRAALRAAVDEVEPGLAGALGEWVPAVMDYEGEVALVALGEIDDEALASGVPQPFGLAAANDLTARIIQVLGEGRARPYDYWARAKSFEGFLPLAPRVWAPTGGIAAIPELVLETWVNGERRQRASTAELAYGLSAMVRAARSHVGRRLARGDVILTGTPAGVGMGMSPLRRWLAARIRDRMRKAELLAASYATSRTLLRPGDVVEVTAGRAGSVRVRLGV